MNGLKENGIILEIRKNEAVVVNNRGQYKRIKRVSGMFLGQMVNYNDKAIVSSKAYRYITAVSGVAALLVFMVFSSVFFMNSQPKIFAYIDIDINPSMEFSIDENERVINLEPLNLDAEKITDSLDLEGININSAVSMVIEKLEEKGFIAPQKKNLILISSSSINKSGLSKVQIDSNNSKLNKTVIALKESILKKKRGTVSVKTINLPTEVKRSAKANKISIGRYVLYNNAVKNGIKITQDEAKSIPLKELIEKTTDKDNLELAAKENRSQKTPVNKQEAKDNMSNILNIWDENKEDSKEDSKEENENNIADEKLKPVDEVRKSDDKKLEAVNKDKKTDKKLEQVNEDRKTDDKKLESVNEDRKTDDKKQEAVNDDSKTDDKKPKIVNEDIKSEQKELKVADENRKSDDEKSKLADQDRKNVEEDKKDKKSEHNDSKSKEKAEQSEKENTDVSINNEKIDEKNDEKNDESLKPKHEDKDNIADKQNSKPAPKLEPKPTSKLKTEETSIGDKS